MRQIVPKEDGYRKEDKLYLQKTVIESETNCTSRRRLLKVRQIVPKEDGYRKQDKLYPKEDGYT